MAPFREYTHLYSAQNGIIISHHTVLPAIYTFIHEWNEPACLLLPGRIASPLGRNSFPVPQRYIHT